MDATMTATPADGTPAPEDKTPLERLTEAVEANLLDFTAWTQLLAHLESDATAAPEKVEATYDRFLGEFPLCFGYWNKYAQYEYTLGSKAPADGVTVVDLSEASGKARAVYERGISAVKHSVDMWLKYCEFVIQTQRAPVDECRAAVEAAVEACGSDPLAGPLWDMFIQLETINNDMLRLNQVFKRIMHQPLSNLDEFWEKYNQFVLAQQLSVLATNDELRELVGEDDMMDEGLLRVKIVNAVEAIKKKTAEGVYRRQTFEAGIDRSYFHVTPVTDASLRNWHNYLDYEEVAGDNARCEVLYERCLIACANYEDMWVRYAAWKEKVAGFDAANEVFQRAVTIFLKYRASIYLEYASFLEAHDKVGEAENMYNKVLSDVAPTLIEAHLRFCNFERRRKNLEATAAAYDRAMESVKDTETDVVAHVATTYATFLHRSCGDVSRTRAVYEHAIEKAGSSLLLWLNYIAFETDASSGSSETFPSAVAALFERAIADSSTLGNDEKNDMWLKYADFMEMYDASIKSVRELYERELMWKRKNGVSRERSMKVLSWSAGSSNATDDYEVGSKRQRVEPSGADAATSAGTIPVAAAASTSATNAYASQYYQGYQGYGAQAYSQAPETAAATPTAAYAQAYSQQYAGYYQQ